MFATNSAAACLTKEQLVVLFDCDVVIPFKAVLPFFLGAFGIGFSTAVSFSIWMSSDVIVVVFFMLFWVYLSAFRGVVFLT